MNWLLGLVVVSHVVLDTANYTENPDLRNICVLRNASSLRW